MKQFSVHPVITPKVFAYAFLAAAVFALTSRYPGYVHHDTSEIVMWSQTGWPLGLPKHPPLLPWMFRLVSYVVPLNWFTLSLLTAGNIVLGAWAVWRIARLYLDEDRAAIALMLYGLSPAGTFFALKLNHNAILVSLWPLTILAFLLCLREGDFRRSAMRGAVFGALAAASMLAKYYSGVLLACCVAAALVSAQRNRFFRMPGGYVAVAVFAILVAPHAWWMWAHQGETLAYALQETGRDKYPMLHFLALAPLYLLPPMAGHLAILRWQGGLEATGDLDAGPRWSPELWVFAAGPFLLTAVFIAALHLRGATSWALPDFSVATVLIAAMVPALDMRDMARLKAAAAWLLAIVAACGPVALMAGFAMGDVNATEPRAEIAHAAGRIFNAAAGRPPVIVAGDPQSANSATISIRSRPMMLSYFKLASSPWLAPDALERDGLLVICRPSVKGCWGQAQPVLQGRSGFICLVPMRRRLLWMTGPVLNDEVAVVLPESSSGGTGAVDRRVAEAACKQGSPDAALVKILLR